MPPRPRYHRPRRQGELNEAARLADRLQQAGYTKRDLARIIPRDPSLVSQFSTKNEGAAFVTALRDVLTAIETGGITDLPELAALAARHTTRGTTASVARARVRTKALLRKLLSCCGACGRAGVTGSGSTCSRPLGVPPRDRNYHGVAVRSQASAGAGCSSVCAGVVSSGMAV